MAAEAPSPASLLFVIQCTLMAMPESETELAHIDRRRARSGAVSYGDPVVLHETSRSRVKMVPFYVRRSTGTDLAVKLVTYRRHDSTSLWSEVAEKSISLQHAAAGRLLRALKEHLAVADEEDGAYIVIRTDGGAAQLGSVAPEDVGRALLGIPARPEIAKSLADADVETEILRAVRGAIRLQELTDGVTQLRNYLDADEADEIIYQKWSEQHSWAFGTQYLPADTVRRIGAGDDVDLLLPSVRAGLRDIAELKRPDHEVMRWDSAHRSWYFSSAASKAIGQCNRYIEVLHDVARQGLRDHPEIVAYYPRALIVIGRSADWSAEQLRELHGLNARLSGITVMTYDQLLGQAERVLDIVGFERPDEDDEYDLSMLDSDDIPSE